MDAPIWSTVAVLVARLIFAAVFLVAVAFKVSDIKIPATMIAEAGLPLPKLLAWLAAMLELALVIAFVSGAFFSEASLVAAVYIIFLAFAFYGPSRWAANKPELFLFINHFAFTAGLLFAAAHGPGTVLAIKSVPLLPVPDQVAQSVTPEAPNAVR